MCRSVLVPLDRSTFAEHALPFALSIARRAGAGLDLVQVHELYALAGPAAGWTPFSPSEDAEWKQKEQTYLDATARWVSAVARVSVTTAVVYGMVADGILERARAKATDLIVMATHARGPVGRFFLGSVADEVLRRAPAPLLVVRASDTQAALLPEPVVGRILLPLDGSPLAEQMLAPALELAQVMEAHCTLLRVIDPSSGSGSNGRQQSEEAEAYLEGVAARLRTDGPRIQTRVAAARHVDEAILEEAHSRRYDLVALATHGRGGTQRLLLGSVADKVIRGLSVPIMVYRPPSA
jgi:nucleotide-binding universal stress UspA family protein